MESRLSEINGCVVLPTYNNHKTLAGVLDRILEVIGEDIILIVVNDG